MQMNTLEQIGIIMDIRKNITIISLFFLSILVSGCGTSEEKKAEIIGKWQSINRKDDIGTTIAFREDSTVGMTSDITINYQYKIDGDYLISYTKDLYSGKMNIDTSQIEFEDKHMKMKRVFNGGEKLTILTRDSDKGENEIFGKWSWVHQTGKSAHSEYYKDGNARSYILLKAREGKYTIDEDTLSMSFSETKVSNETNMRGIIYRISNDTLYFISNDQSIEYAYIRIE